MNKELQRQDLDPCNLRDIISCTPSKSEMSSILRRAGLIDDHETALKIEAFGALAVFVILDDGNKDRRTDPARHIAVEARRQPQVLLIGMRRRKRRMERREKGGNCGRGGVAVQDYRNLTRR